VPPCLLLGELFLPIVSQERALSVERERGRDLLCTIPRKFLRMYIPTSGINR